MFDIMLNSLEYAEMLKLEGQWILALRTKIILDGQIALVNSWMDCNRIGMTTAEWNLFKDIEERVWML